MKNVIISLVMLIVGSGVIMGQSATFTAKATGPINPGSVINFQITCDEIDDEISTFQWFFIYDTTALAPVEVVNYHKDFPHYEWMNNLTYAPNMIILTWLSAEARNRPLKTGEAICEIQFKYLGGKTELKWAKSNSVSKTSEKVFTAMWTDVGKAFYLKLNNAVIGSEE